MPIRRRFLATVTGLTAAAPRLARHGARETRQDVPGTLAKIRAMGFREVEGR